MGGNILWQKIILARRNQQIRMKSVAGNHPWEKKPANQDEFRGRKSSLGEETSKSGCILRPEIIPARRILQIRMNSAAGNHPCEKNSANQDELQGQKVIPE